MKKKENEVIIFNKIKKIAAKDLSLVSTLRLFNIFIKLSKEEASKYIKVFISDFYGIDDMPEEFYELILKQIHGDDYITLFNIFTKRNIYLLISFLKHNQEDVVALEDAINPLQYYLIPQKHINRIIDMLKKLKATDADGYLSASLKDETIWLLKKEPHFDENEYRSIAYKIYLSIGLDNALELLAKKYGEIDYEKVHFLFSSLNTKEMLDEVRQQAFNNFLFGNKKDFNNITRQMLSGGFTELFLNFDYFYNEFNYFVQKLGTKMSRDKVLALLNEKYLAKNVAFPQITGDILDDMLSSYYNRYDFSSTPESEIHKKNFEIYDEFLRSKHKSSIPMMESIRKGPFVCEVIKLSDPRNLILGYRAGNCFRINGDASILFRNFLQSEHMRLLSISTPENKDFAMMLIMRNGNVLIGQGIEVSKWAPSDIKGKKLYDACREVLREMMEYMNAMDDEIVATIIGSSNANVSDYNNQILPFLISPILDNSNNYYNGVCNYQCLLDVREGKSLQDIKLYTPTTRYFDKRDPILRRERHRYDESDNYMEIEKRLISLRYLRMQSGNSLDFYSNLFEHSEVYTCCNKDWYITLFDDDTIDGFVFEGDERAKTEYEAELARIQQMIGKPAMLKYTDNKC